MAKNDLKVKLFVDHYLINLNATQAAIHAGYSEKTAYSSGQRLLKTVEVQKLVSAAMSKRSQATSITAERVLIELGRLAFFDPRKMYNPDGSPKHIHELDDDTAAAVAGMDMQEVTGPDGEFQGYTKKVKLADKGNALNMAMRHLGMLTDKLEIKDTTERSEKLRRARERKAKAE